jgi:hypothetical protein
MLKYCTITYKQPQEESICEIRGSQNWPEEDANLLKRYSVSTNK